MTFLFCVCMCIMYIYVFVAYQHPIDWEFGAKAVGLWVGKDTGDGGEQSVHGC